MTRADCFLRRSFLPARLAGCRARRRRRRCRRRATTNVEVDPIRCWWRTSAGAVRIGEHFDLALTCAVARKRRGAGRAGRVAPRRVGRRDGAVRSASAAAIRPISASGQRRFFQYQYTLRIINPDAIGKDVKIPDTGAFTTR